jgi:hypothetical protein
MSDQQTEQQYNDEGQAIDADGNVMTGEDGQPILKPEDKPNPRADWTEDDVNDALRRAQQVVKRLAFVTDQGELRKRLEATEQGWKDEYEKAGKNVEAWRANLRAAFNGEPMPFPEAPDRTRNTGKGEGDQAEAPKRGRGRPRKDS